MHSNIWSYIPKDVHNNPLIRVEYSPYAMQQTRNIVKFWVDDDAVRRTYVEWISIDWAESKDLDDAIWAEKFHNWYRVYVHISDITEIIKIYSPLDLEALKRTTSIYRKDRVLNMFPEELSQNILSLDENWEKYTLSMKIDLDLNWNITDYDVFESKFKNLKRYDYETFIDDFKNPDSEFHNHLQLMYEIARLRRSQRKTSWANLDYDESDRRSYIWEKDNKISFFDKWISKILIEEFMILANICSAKLMFQNKIDWVFRSHDSQDERAYYTLNKNPHVGLALPDYTHFTSPIRRYSDDIVHRVLKMVYLRELPNPYSKSEIHDISKHINYSREVIDIIWNNIDIEKKSLDKIQKLKKSWENISTSSFTDDIRWNTKSKHPQKLPISIKNEIINDIKNWEKSDWAWCIWVFLLSKEEDIKKVLFDKLLKDTSIAPKAVLNILNETKMFDDWENKNLFFIDQIEQNEKFEITFNFKWEKIFKISTPLKWDENYKNKWFLRKKAVKKIFSHFLNFKEHNIK